MDFINAINIIIFLLISFIHFYWAFGGTFLLDAVIPSKDGVKLFNPGIALTFLVSFIVLGFAFVVYKLAFCEDSSLYIYLSITISALFGLRAIGDFKMVGFFKKIKGTKFAIYDTKYFSPLCLYLSLSMALSVYDNSN